MLFITALLHYQPAGAQPEKFSASVTAGYHVENFDWSIAGDSVNILSELEWKKLRGVSLEPIIKCNVWKSFMLEAHFSKTFISSGTVTDSDYNENNRKSLSARSLFDSNRGTITALEARLGYTFFEDQKFSLTTGIGYSENRQLLYLLDHNGNTGYQLKSTYATRWKGLVLCVEGRFKIMENLGIAPVLQYHQLKYHAEANWNLIINFEHPVSFEHTANGFCVDSGIKISWQLPSSWSVLLVGDCAMWKTGKGIDKLHLKNSPAVYSQFNGAARKEYRAGIELCKAF